MSGTTQPVPESASVLGPPPAAAVAAAGEPGGVTVGGFGVGEVPGFGEGSSVEADVEGVRVRGLGVGPSVGTGVGPVVVGSEVVGTEAVGPEVVGAKVDGTVGSEGAEVAGAEVTGVEVVGVAVVGCWVVGSGAVGDDDGARDGKAVGAVPMPVHAYSHERYSPSMLTANLSYDPCCGSVGMTRLSLSHSPSCPWH